MMIRSLGTGQFFQHDANASAFQSPARRTTKHNDTTSGAAASSSPSAVTMDTTRSAETTQTEASSSPYKVGSFQNQNHRRHHGAAAAGGSFQQCDTGYTCSFLDTLETTQLEKSPSGSPRRRRTSHMSPVRASMSLSQPHTSSYQTHTQQKQAQRHHQQARHEHPLPAKLQNEGDIIMYHTRSKKLVSSPATSTANSSLTSWSSSFSSSGSSTSSRSLLTMSFSDLQQVPEAIYADVRPKSIQYWSDIVNQRQQQQQHSRTRSRPGSNQSLAQAWLQLGRAQLSHPEYATSALESFRQAQASSSSVASLSSQNKSSLFQSQALEGMGKAHFQLQQFLQAQDCFQQAFELRYQLLGPWHVDTVEAFNHVAAVLVQLQHYHQASKAYHEIWTVRSAIFGATHPSVGIAARALGQAHWKLQQYPQADEAFRKAHSILKANGLSENNPILQELKNDRQELQRRLVISKLQDLSEPSIMYEV